MTIRLLVSVRSAVEAELAVESGADIIDVKEPDQGSLGFAGPATINAVVRAVRGRVPVSAALGECREWLADDSRHQPPETTSLIGVEELAVRTAGLRGLNLMKLGLANMLPAFSANPLAARDRSFTAADRHFPNSAAVPTEDDWCRLWQRMRDAISAGIASSRSSGRIPDWVAVAYADEENSSSPPLASVFEAAVASKCRYLLLDTFRKDGMTTLDWLTCERLRQLADKCRLAGIGLALAGQLTAQHLKAIGEIRPDVLAVRGAVCNGFDRRQSLCGLKIAALRRALNSI